MTTNWNFATGYFATGNSDSWFSDSGIERISGSGFEFLTTAQIPTGQVPTVGIPAGGMLGEVDWITLIIYSGVTLGVAVIGVYLVMAVKDWMQSPREYSSTGDDLESLREALELGSIDEEEYRKAVKALKDMSDRLAVKPAEPLKGELTRERMSAASFEEVIESAEPSNPSETKGNP